MVRFPPQAFRVLSIAGLEQRVTGATAAGRILAAHLADLRYAEGSFGTLLLSEDIALQELRFGPGGAAPSPGDPRLNEVQDPLPRVIVDDIRRPPSGNLAENQLPVVPAHHIIPFY